MSAFRFTASPPANVGHFTLLKMKMEYDKLVAVASTANIYGERRAVEHADSYK